MVIPERWPFGLLNNSSDQWRGAYYCSRQPILWLVCSHCYNVIPYIETKLPPSNLHPLVLVLTSGAPQNPSPNLLPPVLDSLSAYWNVSMKASHSVTLTINAYPYAYARPYEAMSQSLPVSDALGWIIKSWWTFVATRSLPFSRWAWGSFYFMMCNAMYLSKWRRRSIDTISSVSS